MNEIKFRAYLTKTGHSEKSINSRISKLRSIENYFQLNIDTIITNKERIISLLINIRNSGIEERRHTPFSNALRKYYTCMTNDEIGRIF